MTKTAYIVWNEARNEGYVTFDRGVAYEARKSAGSNCFDADGTQMHLAQAFCELTGQQNNTVQVIEMVSEFNPDDFHQRAAYDSYVRACADRVRFGEWISEFSFREWLANGKPTGLK